jgi:prepilin-type N-terminal cleavage/methylation domain-containing protein
VRRGFTLIETAVVLLVLALAAGLAAPAIGRGLDAIRLRAEVAGVASFLRAARARAIAQHRALQVEIEGEGSALVVRSGDADPARDGDRERLVRRLSPLVRLGADPPQARTVTFFAYGLSSGGRFRLETPGAAVYVVTVDPLTGRVTTRRSES